jgi:hypothetical protein
MDVNFEIEVERDGEYLTIWDVGRNALICVDTHYSEVAAVYLQYIKDSVGPGPLLNYEIPAPLLDWNHDSWFIED